MITVLDLEVAFSEGEELPTGITAKLRRDGVAAELADAGLRLRSWWTDHYGDYALSLASTETA